MARRITAEEVEPQNPGPGHNGPTEETFLKHVRAVVRANLAMDEARVARQAIRKLAKADGVELKKLDAVITMTDWEPGEVRDHFSTLGRYAIWIGLPIGTQPDMFDGIPDAAKPALDWHAKGYTASTTGKGQAGKPPGDCPPDQIQAWMKGWQEGQEKIASQMPSAREPATVQ